MDTSNGPQNVYPMPERSTSTAIDERSAVLVGSTERRVHFNLVQTLGMIFSITAPPIGIGLYLSLIVGVGGFRFYIWGYLFSAFFQLITCLAVAELASAIPHSSGPAFWVQQLAPVGCSQFLGYLVGWLTNGLWWFVSAADNLYLAQLTLGLAMALNPGFNPPAWQYFLVYCAWAVLSFVNNLPRIFKILPHCLTAGTIIINGTALYLLVALLVRATPKPTAREIFTEPVNDTGWPSDGVVFFLSLLPGLLTVNGFDSVTHITDELETPTKQVPLVMLCYGLLSAISGFVMAIVYSFCAVNSKNLLNPYGHQPLIQLIFDASRSTAIATVGCVGVITSLYLSTVASFTSWNRLYWSFSRDGGLPFPRTMSKLSSVDSVPVNAMIVNLMLIIALGAIQLGSLTALTAILGGAAIFATTSYTITFALALWRGRSFLAKDRWLDLGRIGVIFRTITVLWCIFISVWLCFPLYLPITLAYMNWTSLIVVGVVVVSLIYWFAFRQNIKRI